MSCSHIKGAETPRTLDERKAIIVPINDARRPPIRYRARQNLFGTLSTKAAVALLMILPRSALAAPHGGTVVEGQANIFTNGNVTNINQSSYEAIINWQQFSIGPKETVNFNQPSSSSVTLNWVTGNETSIISGALNATGQSSLSTRQECFSAKTRRLMLAASSHRRLIFQTPISGLGDISFVVTQKPLSSIWVKYMLGMGAISRCWARRSQTGD